MSLAFTVITALPVFFTFTLSSFSNDTTVVSAIVLGLKDNTGTSATPCNDTLSGEVDELLVKTSRPVFAPPVSGVNCSFTSRLSCGPTTAGLPETTNDVSPLLAQLTRSVSVPVFFTFTLSALLDPTATVSVRVFGDTAAMANTCPVPVNFTESGDEPALLVKSTPPSFTPPLSGANVATTDVLSPGATFAESAVM
jgi:hypothetical protein